MEAQERQGGNIPGVPTDPPPLGFLSHYFSLLGPLPGSSPMCRAPTASTRRQRRVH